jgi:hypothetical protein
LYYPTRLRCDKRGIYDRNHKPAATKLHLTVNCLAPDNDHVPYRLCFLIKASVVVGFVENGLRTAGAARLYQLILIMPAAV